MAYVPGYTHDLFISYAHGDDREWTTLFVSRLETALKQRLGAAPAIWFDTDKLRASRDFSTEIPDSVRSSAVFLLFTSPTYLASRYCVEEECRAFDGTKSARKARFATDDFANEQFAFRCPIVATDNNEHWSLFPGLTDIPFCDDNDTFPVGGAPFETSFRRLVAELVGLLKRMRNHSTSVFLYPPDPPPEIASSHEALANELAAHSYRILPDNRVNLGEQLRKASMSVFLLGPKYDDGASDLVDVAASEVDKPWVVWSAPAVDERGDANQLGFRAYLERHDSRNKTYLHSGIMAAKLKEEVLALLGPSPNAAPATDGKPRVYLVYNARDRTEVQNAGLISFAFRRECDFDHPDDPAQHTNRLTRSDGVLLVWGSAEQAWCEREFEEMLQTSGSKGVRGVCLFDPAEMKSEAVRAIRDGLRDVFVGEQFGGFDPSRLDPFFRSLLQRREQHP